MKWWNCCWCILTETEAGTARAQGLAIGPKWYILPQGKDFSPRDRLHHLAVGRLCLGAPEVVHNGHFGAALLWFGVSGAYGRKLYFHIVDCRNSNLKGHEIRFGFQVH